MPKVGDKEFDYTPEGVAEARRESEATGIPMSDGAKRSVTEYAGGGKVGYDSIGGYKEGGKVKLKFKGDPTSSVKEAGEQEKEAIRRYKKLSNPSDYDTKQAIERQKWLMKKEAFKKRIGVKKGEKLSDFGQELLIHTSVRENRKHQDKIAKQKVEAYEKATGKKYPTYKERKASGQLAKEIARDRAIEKEKEKRQKEQRDKRRAKARAKKK